MNRLVRSKSGDNLLLIMVLVSGADMAAGQGETVITVTEAASELGMKRQSILKKVKADLLIPVAWWDGKLLFRESDVKKLKEERQRESEREGQSNNPS